MIHYKTGWVPEISHYSAVSLQGEVWESLEPQLVHPQTASFSNGSINVAYRTFIKTLDNSGYGYKFVAVDNLEQALQLLLSDPRVIRVAALPAGISGPKELFSLT